MTVKEIIQKWLRENGYSGLYNEIGCGCTVENLMLCGESCENCQPGYNVFYAGGPHNFGIQPKKPVEDL